MRAVLKLYLVGGTPPSDRALASLPGLRAALGEAGEVQVVDLAERPEVAEAERILATPLLVREEPLPVRRIAGDLSDPERVVWTLGLGRTTT
jgi:circadian clock protein KaiB